MKGNHCKSWTMYEIEIMKTMLDDKLSHGEIGEALGRSPGAVSQFLVINHMTNPRRGSEIKEYMKAHPHITDATIKLKFNIVQTTVWKYRKQLGLPTIIRKPAATEHQIIDWKNKRLDGMTYKEISEISGYSPAGIRNALIRWGELV